MRTKTGLRTLAGLCTVLLLTGCAKEQNTEPAETTAAQTTGIGTAAVTQTTSAVTTSGSTADSTAAITAANTVNSTAAVKAGNARETDLSARFPEYMQYSFGEGFSMDYLRTDEKTGADCYAIRYTDHTGKQRTVSERNAAFLSYENRLDSDLRRGEAEYYDVELAALVENETVAIFKDELEERVLKPSFPTYDETASNLKKLGSASLSAVIVPLMIYDLSAPEDLPLIQARYQAGTGLQVCNAGLETTGCDENWYFVLSCTVEAGEDAAPIVSQMQEAYKRYLREAGHPQNVTMLVRQKQDAGLDTLYRTDLVFGEQVDCEQKQQSEPGYNPKKDAEARIREKHGYTVSTRNQTAEGETD